MNLNLTTKYARQAEMLANRVRKRYRHLRKRFQKQGIDVFRLYDWDIPEIRAVVDWYAGHLVVGEYVRRQSTAEWLPVMGMAVAEALDVPTEKLHLKERYAGRQDGERYKRLNTTGRKFPVRERDLRFLVNPWDYVDTGLFSDHRNTRQMVRKAAAGKDLLNLYCYTGTFTCYAAKGGARSTVSVDRSRTAIDWAGENLQLNKIAPEDNKLIQSSVNRYLDKARKEKRTFDLVVVDPPSYFSFKVGDEHFDVARDHPELLEKVAAVMRPEATIFFSTNHQNFELYRDRLPVSEAREITDRTIPEDYLHKRKKIHRCWRMTV